jgi:hypothetical protein
MSVTQWSWILAGLNMLGLYINWQVGNRHRWAWLGYVLIEGIWITYAIDTSAYGFILSASAFAAVAIRNYIKWNPARVDPTPTGG